jgi:hypothetical protein
MKYLSDGFKTLGVRKIFSGATVCIHSYRSKPVAFATGETAKNNIYLTINKLRIVIKSKPQQNRNSRRKRAAIKRQCFWAPNQVIHLPFLFLSNTQDLKPIAKVFDFI